jgi:CheY-like chemotaxis protein
MPANPNTHLLVVDDDELVRRVLTDTLRLSGYLVTACADGPSAIEEYKNNGSSIDLVVLDLIMPGMNGTQVLFNLLRLNPDVKVLVISGLDLDLKDPELLRCGAKGVASKPFQLSDLIYRVEKILSGS